MFTVWFPSVNCHLYQNKDGCHQCCLWWQVLELPSFGGKKNKMAATLPVTLLEPYFGVK